MAKILIIDDDAAFAGALGKFLGRQGHEILTAADGQAGLAAARQNPDLIVCDLAMPALSGHGVLAALRQDMRLEEVPFLFISGCATRDDVRHGMNLGGDDFLTKPAELPEILAAVNARLERRQRQRARQAEQVQTAVKIFSGIVDDLGSPTAALHWLAEAAAGEKPAALPPEPPELPKSPETILAVKDNRRFFVKLSEIKALLADGEYSRAYWGKDQHMMFRKPLKQWERELSAQQFIRIHRNAIINLAFLDFMRQSPAGQRQIHLKDFPEVLEVSQRKAAAVNRALKNFPRR